MKNLSMRYLKGLIMEEISRGYYIKIVDVPQTPVDNKNNIVIVYHAPTQTFEACNKYRSSHKNKTEAIKKLKEKVDRMVVRKKETIEQIMQDEGYREIPYLCSEGKLTWLFGRNIKDRPITSDEWNKLEDILRSGKDFKQWAEQLFNEDIHNLTIHFHKNGLSLGEMHKEVAIIILNMAYNMGPTKFSKKKWPLFFKAIEEEDYENAAYEMVNSKWYTQVNTRAVRLVYSMSEIANEIKSEEK